MTDLQETREFTLQSSEASVKGCGVSTPSLSIAPSPAYRIESAHLLSRFQVRESKPTYQPGEQPDPLPAFPCAPVPIDEGAACAALYQILNTVDADLETVLSQVAASLAETLQADCCIVAVQANSTAERQAVTWLLEGGQTLYTDSVALWEHPAIAQALEISEAFVIETGDTPPLYPALEVQGIRLPAHKICSIRLPLPQPMQGWISIGRSRSDPWSLLELNLLKTMSEQVAFGISHLLVQQQRNAEVQRQTFLSQLIKATWQGLDLSQIFRLSASGIAQALQVEQVQIVLLKYSEPFFKKPTLVRAHMEATFQSRETHTTDASHSTPYSDSESADAALEALEPSRPERRISRARATVTCEWPPRLECEEQGVADLLLGELQSTQTCILPSFWLSECAVCQQAFVDAPLPFAIADANDSAKIDATQGLAPIFDPVNRPAVLVMPLVGASSSPMTQGAVLGFLILQHSQVRCWQPEELELVELVSAQVSTAIIQTQTLRQVQALVDERTAQLQRSLAVQAKLYEKSRQQVEQLRHLNELKNEFLSTMSHELLTPLTSMTMAIRMLRQPGLDPERYAKYLDILEQQCLQETSLISDLLALQKLESKNAAIQLQRMNLQTLLQDVKVAFDQKWASKGLELVVELPERSLMLESDLESINRILVELLTNAGKYSEANSPVHLKVTQQLASLQPSEPPINQIVLTLTNTGAGIAPEELPFIFDKFRRGRGVTQQAIPGTGLGLALVKSLVHHLNGDVTVACRPLGQPQVHETCFTVSLPQFFDHTRP